MMTVPVPAEPVQETSVPSPAEAKAAPQSAAQQTVEPVRQAPWRVAGEVLRTYIICEDGQENVWLIDKHAAHERVRFDALKNNTQPVMSQQLLSPLAVELSAEDAASLLEQLPLLEEFGFAAEDFGGGSLRLFRELPHVGGIVDGDDAQKQSKLTTMLIDTLDLRKKLLAGQGLVSIDAYREATGEQLPWIVLLLDHVAPALELYPDIDGFLQTLVRDGAACGMYLLVSAGAVNALPYRISQHIKAAVCLRMTDRGDYAQIVGKTNGLEPENLAGRGLVRSTPPLEFQTALPAAGKREIDRVNEIRRLAGLMRGAWTGACPPPIPVLPEVVDWREYPSEQILCGLTEQSVQPCFAALAQEQFLLISCAQDGSSTVQAIFAQAAEKLAPAKHIVFHGAQAQAAAAFDGEIAALMPEMQKRKDASAGSTDWPWILICIDDLKRCIDSINDQTLRRLASILVLGKGLRVAVIVSGNAADITKLSASGERFTMEMTGKTTLLLGGSAQAHMFARTDLAYSAASQDAGAGMGYLVQDGHAVKLKAVQK